MIKALMLSFQPAVTWEKIKQANRSVGFVLFTQLIPLVALSVAGEMAGKIFLGQQREMGGAIPISRELAISYGVAQFLLSIVVVFICAKLVKSLAETFHTRHTFSQCFAVVSYGLSPFFLLRLLDAFPRINPWLTFAVGIVLSAGVLYHGLPHILEPDPPHAFGLFVMSCLLIAMVAGLARLVTLMMLAGKIHLV